MPPSGGFDVSDLRRPNKVRRFIEAGGDVESPVEGGNGSTMLAEAVRLGYRESSQVLLEANANVNAVGRLGDSVLSARCSITDTAHGDLASMCSLLLEHGARVNFSDATNGFTPLTNVLLGSGNQEAVALLIAHQANVSHVISQSTLETLSTKTEGMSPLTIAARAGRADLIKLLLEAGAEEWAGGRSALHLACEMGCAVSVEVLLSRPSSSIEKIDNAGFTPLIVACRNANHSAAEMLLTHGADVNALDTQGRSALLCIGSDAPKGASLVPVAELLLARKADTT